MAQQLLVLKEVLAMLKVTGAPNRVIDAFRTQAEQVLQHRNRYEGAEAYDDVQVTSGYGADTKRGTVELTVNNERTQMDTKKAREVGLLLLQAAEAAESDEMFMTLLTRLGIPEEDHERRGLILLDLREIRQGSRELVRPH
jgi:hypothetical protein